MDLRIQYANLSKITQLFGCVIYASISSFLLPKHHFMCVFVALIRLWVHEWIRILLFTVQLSIGVKDCPLNENFFQISPLCMNLACLFNNLHHTISSGWGIFMAAHVWLDALLPTLTLSKLTVLIWNLFSTPTTSLLWFPVPRVISYTCAHCINSLSMWQNTWDSNLKEERLILAVVSEFSVFLFL
jgi:hypothetical protein